VISIANTLKGGDELNLDDFGNNVDIPFKILSDKGFEVVKKNDDLIMRLKPKELIKYIFETNIENIQKSFLAQNKGLSALCLLYKTKMSHQELTEIFGDSVQFNNISTASVPEFVKEISQYCDIKIHDNNSIIVQSIKNEIKINVFDKFEINLLNEWILKTGLTFDEKLITRFITSLLTKPFVILSGLSGSGKTKLAQAFVQWICESKEQYKIIPVGADWTNREPLLGYPNGLDNKTYITPDSGALQLILEATGNKNKPYFMILDEMNLSHVERYFADFLSIMESKDSIKLYSGNVREDSEGNKISKEISWPSNLFIIGTVNIDETTYMFSPKDLDRANVIEFRITKKEIETFLENPHKPELKNLTAQGATMSESFLEIANTNEVEKNESAITELGKFFNELKKVGAEFGYRSASEIIQLITKLKTLDNSINDNDSIDIAIMQKLLPKLHGSRSKLVKILIALSGLCIEGITVEEFEKKFDDFYKNDFDGIDKKYPISFEKIIRMYKNVLANGFTSYAEA
jgi:5-methylcytosine-specific restriction protein B